jgi:hypothetical protein
MRALMRGAGKRQMLLREPCRVRRAAFDERERLDHLDRASRQDRQRRVAPTGDESFVMVPYGHVPAMQALNHWSAYDPEKLRCPCLPVHEFLLGDFAFVSGPNPAIFRHRDFL